MAAASTAWRKGRGKLGILDPLLGDWEADADSPQGAVHCTRAFRRALGDGYVQLAARWELPEPVYEELTLFGVDDAGRVAFWSFTSDGKRSHGVLAAAPHVHAEAIAFGAQRPSGAPDLLAGRGGRVLVGGGGVEDEGRLEPVRGAPLPGAGGAGGRAMLAWRELARPHANARDTKQHSERSRPAPHQAPSGLREAR